MKAFIYYFVIVAVFCVSSLSGRALELDYEVREDTEFHKDALQKKENENKQYALKLTIGERYIEIDQSGQKKIFDFNLRRIFAIDKDKKTFRSESLFADVGFRAMEFRNRMFLGNVLAEASVKDHPMKLAINEHLFSLQKDKKNSNVTLSSENSEILFHSDATELFRYEKGGLSVKKFELKKFLQFLRYYTGGHPDILRHLVGQRRVPKEFVITQYNPNKVTKAFSLKKSTIVNSVSYDLAGYSPEKFEGKHSDLFNSIQDIWNEGSINFTGNSKRTLLEAESLCRDKHYFPCFLAYLEYTLQTGEEMPQSFFVYNNTMKADKDVGAFLSVLQPQSENEAKLSLPIYEDLRSGAEGKLYVLQIFEANIRSGLGENDQAFALFLNALKNNKYLTGVYKDLGDIYYNDYEAYAAWRCWDVGRMLAPNFVNFKKIKELEDMLLKENPEYF